jgi:hypothetical protein
MAAKALNEATSFVYVIGPDAGPFKIGVANDVDKRLAQIQVDRPDRLAVLHRQKVPSSRRYDVEKHAHAALNAVRVRGEWFATDRASAIAAVQSAANDIEAGALNPGPSEAARSRGVVSHRRRKTADGLTTVLRGAAPTDRQKLAALLYRRVFDTAAHEAAMVERGGTVGLRPTTVAISLLAKLHAAVTRRATPRSATLLIEVAGKGSSVNSVPGTGVQRRRQRLELLLALDVVADTLTGPER